MNPYIASLLLAIVGGICIGYGLSGRGTTVTKVFDMGAVAKEVRDLRDAVRSVSRAIDATRYPAPPGTHSVSSTWLYRPVDFKNTQEPKAPAPRAYMAFKDEEGKTCEP